MLFREASQRTGAFRFLFADECWEWSPEIERMHGYGPGECHAPSTETVLAHAHPDERSQVATLLAELACTAKPLSAGHRIVDTRGRVRDVLVVADVLRDGDGTPIGVGGFYVDVTPTDDWALQRSVTDAVAEITETRGGIEQAKGMLMLVYHLSAETAFDLLRWRSQATNVKVRALGEQIVKDFAGLTGSDELPPRSSFDQMLLTAHRRMKSIT